MKSSKMSGIEIYLGLIVHTFCEKCMDIYFVESGIFKGICGQYFCANLTLKYPNSQH